MAKADLEEFIDKLFNRYKCLSLDVEDRKSQYVCALFDKIGKVDFKKLLKLIDSEHKKEFLPSAGMVLEWCKKCYSEEYKRDFKPYIQVKIYNPIIKKIISTDAFEQGTSPQMILDYYEKKSKVKGWKIIEVY